MSWITRMEALQEVGIVGTESLAIQLASFAEELGTPHMQCIMDCMKRAGMIGAGWVPVGDFWHLLRGHVRALHKVKQAAHEAGDSVFDAIRAEALKRAKQMRSATHRQMRKVEFQRPRTTRAKERKQILAELQGAAVQTGVFEILEQEAQAIARYKRGSKQRSFAAAITHPDAVAALGHNTCAYILEPAGLL